MWARRSRASLLGDPASRYENRAPGVAVHGTRLITGTHDGRLLAVDARTGEIQWEFKTGDAVIATPVVANGRVFCGSFDGFVYALDAATGALAWKHDTGGPVTSAVAVSGDRVVAGSRSFDIEALDARTGAAAWTRYVWFSWVESPAAVFRSAIYVGSSDAAKIVLDRRGNRPRELDRRRRRQRVGPACGHRHGGLRRGRRRPALHRAAPRRAHRPGSSHGHAVVDLPRRAAARGGRGADAVRLRGMPSRVGAGKVFAAGLDGTLYAFAR